MRNMTLVGSNITYLRPVSVLVPANPSALFEEGPTRIKVVPLCVQCFARPVESSKKTKCEQCVLMLFNRRRERDIRKRRIEQLRTLAILTAVFIVLLMAAPFLGSLFK